MLSKPWVRERDKLALEGIEDFLITFDRYAVRCL